ncbi:GMC family oxidoreductase N-terminal domain-containing protein [Enterovibrio sp. ZSDZ42]|uniref:GMC family oxidoreductase N-terminal domain-containing protein n=1 Tax=Enterovibrio gelatinilyticus TaxID=2899819 RepID=A0ABT5QUT1_9GAMM|nr:GMC family oxidoreductase N-terminal domain-containing protein [Enterovibrio sp. ZSDZ42]MDD1791764.1 GMC family oxidoreductase N-terminal domain-containing protein [Enterovibrio sp. ZSDZ42]
MPLVKEIFDYVIIGGGTAGALLTNRLSENGASVCLLEAGPSDINPLIHIPAGYIKNVYSKTLTWGFEAEASAGTAGRRFSLPQGRVLGGSSSINGLNHNRGQRADFDHWAALGNPGWSYNEVLPYFRRSEHKIGKADKRYRGLDGELSITDLDWHHPVSEAFVKGAQELGIPENPDYNGARQDGVGYYQRCINKGFRISSARAFLGTAKKRPSVEVRTNAQATAILFEGKRAVGVSYMKGGPSGKAHNVMARREVIVSAGTINTAKLLQISGVGDAKLLAELGVPVVHDLPGVGNNLRDHYGVRMVSRVKGIRTINSMAQGPRLLLEIGRWLLRKPSLLAVSPSLAHAFWKSDETMDKPDLQFVFSPASFREGVVGLLDKKPGMTTGVWQERPESTGFVRARSSNPFDTPIVQPNYLANEKDQQVLLAGMRLARRLMRTSTLAPYFDHETAPGDDVQTDEELLDFARKNGTTVYHLIGTARMGPDSDPEAVVDAQLRVHGLDGLRVVDASIMPSMPSANTNAATLMIAEKASDMIRGLTPLAPAENIANEEATETLC